jgi:hypothetical protein
VWEALGRTITIGVFSGLLASIPLAILKLAHQRRFVRVLAEEVREWKLQIRRWQRRDAFIYVAGTLYSLFAINYVLLFSANVAAEDQMRMYNSSSLSFAQELFLFPMLWSLEITCVALCLRGRYGGDTADAKSSTSSPTASVKSPTASAQANSSTRSPTASVESSTASVESV